MPRTVLSFLAIALLPPAYVMAESGPLWAGVTALYWIPPIILFDAPVVYFLRRRLTFLKCCAIGTAGGLLGASLILFGYVGSLWKDTVVLEALGGLFWGGIVFWIIAVWGNPYYVRQLAEKRSNAAT